MIQTRSPKILEKNGFTLIELIVVIAIIGILTGISVPNYSTFVRRAQYTTLKTILDHLMDGQDIHMLENGEFYPNNGRVNVARGAYKKIDALGYTFTKGHAHRFRIRGRNNKKNNRYIIDVWADYDFNGNGKNDRIQCITWLRNGKIFRDNNRKIKHLK